MPHGHRRAAGSTALIRQRSKPRPLGNPGEGCAGWGSGWGSGCPQPCCTKGDGAGSGQEWGGLGVRHLLCPVPRPHVHRAAAEACERPRQGCSCSAGRAGTVLGNAPRRHGQRREIGAGVWGQLRGDRDAPDGCQGWTPGVQTWQRVCANPASHVPACARPGLAAGGGPCPDGGAPCHGRLLVGAPQAPALPSQGANRTGGLFACPLTPELSDCWRVPIDEGGELCSWGGAWSAGGPPPGSPNPGVPAGADAARPCQWTCSGRARRTSGWG